MAAQTDFWGDIELAPVRTPLAIMREQAALLGSKTRNLVEAEVHTRAYGNGFEHVFNLVVPAFDSYTYQLFVVRHGPDLYPATAYVGGDGEMQTTEGQFTEWLRTRLSSEETKKIVGNLLSQASGR